MLLGQDQVFSSKKKRTCPLKNPLAKIGLADPEWRAGVQLDYQRDQHPQGGGGGRQTPPEGIGEVEAELRRPAAQVQQRGIRGQGLLQQRLQLLPVEQPLVRPLLRAVLPGVPALPVRLRAVGARVGGGGGGARATPHAKNTAAVRMRMRSAMPPPPPPRPTAAWGATRRQPVRLEADKRHPVPERDAPLGAKRAWYMLSK